ncbi:hypothetical protein VCRA2119O147_150045 [Vibrio crassostreae]|uniref:Uncharacterized protein n=1 Tax=Vibrio crassostreae TaxID=246167 RepID=A0A822N3W0_9VIBR|nr:hypothetical protein VCRA2112O187_30052 [Vibrio crassostreae]CAK2184428.1 hypothetical protein VCRA2112O191_50063 [Vibrio crassostreae]CAK2185787.1 hypothetical protein VCRA2116O234_50152 [Vibrio crassostreae]CAK2194660.1 hypothetical protein VCRA2110O135_80158 [Vibrio crassostreae]CAK2196199.1 hypothetical protein VCRA2113O138_70059 [Vibrio crassostreae]
MDKHIDIPPTNGTAPLCSFLEFGLSTKPTLLANFRIKNSEEQEKKPTKDSSKNMMNSSQFTNSLNDR